MELASRPGKMPSWHRPSDRTRTDRWCTSRSFAPTLQASMHCLHSQRHPCERPLTQLGMRWHAWLALLPKQERCTRQLASCMCSKVRRLSSCMLDRPSTWLGYSPGPPAMK